MTIRTTALLFILLIFSGCAPEKDKLIQEFKLLYSNIEEGNFDYVYDHLDSKSKDFVDALTDPQNLNFETITEIGNKNWCTFNCIQYYLEFSNHFKSSNPKSDFFKHLTFNGTSLFTYLVDYEVVEKQSRVGKDNYVVIGENTGEALVTVWIKFSKEEDQYLLDLISLMQHEERVRWGETLRGTNARKNKREQLERYSKRQPQKVDLELYKYTKKSYQRED